MHSLGKDYLKKPKNPAQKTNLQISKPFDKLDALEVLTLDEGGLGNLELQLLESGLGEQAPQTRVGVVLHELLGVLEPDLLQQVPGVPQRLKR